MRDRPIPARYLPGPVQRERESSVCASTGCFLCRSEAYCERAPPILQPISHRPNPSRPSRGDGEPDPDAGNPRHTVDETSVSDGGNSPIASFVHLTRLFAFIDGDLVKPPSTITLAPPETVTNDPTRRQVAVFQSDLDPAAAEEAEAGPWRWMRRNPSTSSSSAAGSASRCGSTRYGASPCPATGSRRPCTLGFFSTVSAASICAHGYRMVTRRTVLRTLHP